MTGGNWKKTSTRMRLIRPKNSPLLRVDNCATNATIVRHLSHEKNVEVVLKLIVLEFNFWASLLWNNSCIYCQPIREGFRPVSQSQPEKLLPKSSLSLYIPLRGITITFDYMTIIGEHAPRCTATVYRHI
jgi:hypothetical protein